ncbi:hypothetical protein IFM89_016362 [Coptis chinensis]|uniref:Pentatricopeptide repeat-containing protein n=1 Tax=Coptis chinensis TaxID=261450 RepID=A0A835LRV4_9MAGN|nr:hypothetical protein IFM89_016362 [Coptis chinensis]
MPEEKLMKGLPSAHLGVSRMWSYVAILSKYVNGYQLVVTQASTSDHKVTDGVLSGLIAEEENDPVFYKETCTAYIERLCKSGKDFELLSKIFKDALVSCNFLNPLFYPTLAKAFLNSTDFVPLLKFVGEVSEMKCPKSTIIINRIIIAFAESKQIDKAIMIFDLMKGLNCKPDRVTYNIVMDILGRAGWIDEMLHAFASMKEFSLIPDIISYNTLINSFRKLGRLDLCVVFLQEMRENGVDPDLQTYTAVIDSFGRLGHIKEALGYFGQMKRRGIHPSIYIYRSLIRAYELSSKIEELHDLHLMCLSICGFLYVRNAELSEAE